MMSAIRTGLICLAAAGALFAQELQVPGVLLQQAAPRARSISTTRMGTIYLGVGVVEVTEERAKALNLKDTFGVEVKHVEENSPAAKAGLKDGDVVLEYNGQRVEGVEQFIRLISETPAGRKANLNVWRSGSTMSISAILEVRNRALGNTMVLRIPDTPPPPSIPDITQFRGMITGDFPNLMVSSTRIGLEVESVSGQLADFFGVKQGVLVRSVVGKSPAEKAGLKAGDVIVKIAGTPVMTGREITGAVRAAKGKIAFTVVRNKKEMNVEVSIPENRGALTSADRLVLE